MKNKNTTSFCLFLLKIIFVVSATTNVNAQTALASPIVQSAVKLNELVSERQPQIHTFVKDAPILTYVITTSQFELWPQEISSVLGSIDKTQYTPEYLEKNIGSVVALQVKGDVADFYIIGKSTFESKYKQVPTPDVATKNAKYLGKLSKLIPNLIASQDTNLIAVLKQAPVAMIKMTDLGYQLNEEVVIESPWGEQTKPAGQEAYLVFDESAKKLYMVNVDLNGLPLSYIPAP